VIGQEKTFMKKQNFIDSNILIYAFDDFEKIKRPLARSLINQKLINSKVFICTQVLNEFCSAFSRKGVPCQEIKKFIAEITNSFIITQIKSSLL
jgi:predicted nucleic acid-binding protein